MRAWIALLATLLLAACAAPGGPPEPAVQALFADARFGPPSERVDAAEVFAISPEMKRYLEVDAADKLRKLGAQKGLVEALYSQGEL